MTVEVPDNDADGIPDDLDDDDDNDGMSDICENTYGFNPLNASDALKDSDNDGISNVTECGNGTDPTVFTSLVDTGIPMIGFDYQYKVYGKMDSNDLYVVRDSGAAGIPGVSEFYLRENEDAAQSQFYDLHWPVSRTSAERDGFTHNTNYDLKLRDINGDNAQDLIISGLEDIALGRWDVMVFARTSTHSPPLAMKEIDHDVQRPGQTGG